MKYIFYAMIFLSINLNLNSVNADNSKIEAAKELLDKGIIKISKLNLRDVLSISSMAAGVGLMAYSVINRYRFEPRGRNDKDNVVGNAINFYINATIFGLGAGLTLGGWLAK